MLPVRSHSGIRLQCTQRHEQSCYWPVFIKTDQVKLILSGLVLIQISSLERINYSVKETNHVQRDSHCAITQDEGSKSTWRHGHLPRDLFRIITLWHAVTADTLTWVLQQGSGIRRRTKCQHSSVGWQTVTLKTVGSKQKQNKQNTLPSLNFCCQIFGHSNE